MASITIFLTETLFSLAFYVTKLINFQHIVACGYSYTQTTADMTKEHTQKPHGISENRQTDARLAVLCLD